MAGTGDSSIKNLLSTQDRLLAVIGRLRTTLTRTRELLQKLEGALDSMRLATEALKNIEPVFKSVVRGCDELSPEPEIGSGFGSAGGSVQALLDGTGRVMEAVSRSDDTVKPMRLSLANMIRRFERLEISAERFEQLVKNELAHARGTDRSLGKATKGRYRGASVAGYARAGDTLSPRLAGRADLLGDGMGTLRRVIGACELMLEVLEDVAELGGRIDECGSSLRDKPERMPEVTRALDRSCLGVSVRDALEGDCLPFPRNKIVLKLAHKIIDPFVDSAMPRPSIAPQTILEIEDPCVRTARTLEQTWRIMRSVAGVLEDSLSSRSVNGLYSAVPA